MHIFGVSLVPEMVNVHWVHVQIKNNFSVLNVTKTSRHFHAAVLKLQIYLHLELIYQLQKLPDLLHALVNSLRHKVVLAPDPAIKTWKAQNGWSSATHYNILVTLQQTSPLRKYCVLIMYGQSNQKYQLFRKLKINKK